MGLNAWDLGNWEWKAKTLKLDFFEIHWDWDFVRIYAGK